MGVNGIYGLSGSGLDVESMVKVGMLSKQSEYDKMQQKYTKNEWTKAAYVDVYNKIQTFNNSTLSQYKMSANMNARNAESSSSEIKVTANASAPQMTHYVEVGKAATNAYLIGTNSVKRLGDSQTSTQLRDALFKSVTTVGDNVTTIDGNGNTSVHSKNDVAFQFTVGNGTKNSINLNNSNSSVLSVTADDDAEDGEYNISVSQLASAAEMTGSTVSMARQQGTSDSTALKDLLFSNLTISGNTVTSYTGIAGSGGGLSENDSAIEFTLSDGTNSTNISISYNQIDSGYGMQDLADQINSAGLNIEATFDSDTQTFSLVNKDTGINSEIGIQVASDDDTSGNYVGSNTAAFLNGLGLADAAGTSLSFNASTSSTPATTTAKGTDAVLTINNETVTQSTNEVSKNGLNLTLTDTGDTTVKIDRYELDADKNTVSITYGQLAEGYTFNDLTVSVNNLGLSVKATYDSVNDKFSFYNSETGSEKGVVINTGNDNATDFFNAIGLKKSANGEIADKALTFSTGTNTGVNGTNANVKVDGVDYDIADNKLVVNGVTYNFTGATEGTKSTVNITQDTDKIIDKVKSFVEDYNKLLKDLTDMYNEKPNKNYKPLTDSQRDAMKDEQIEKWEEKAKAGMLYHDKTLDKLISGMRDAVSTPIEGIEGKYNNIFSLGISTTGAKGQLTLDEDKLRAALSDDPEAVYNVFAKLDSKDVNNASKSGVAQRLGDVFTSNMKNIKSVSGTDMNTADDSDLSKLMRELQTKMSNFKSMMNAFENKLYKKYDSMETALARLGTQLNYVTSSFS